MLDVYFWTTPNGYKVLILLEELGLDYRVKPINISKGEQFDESFLAISPNNRIPALVDHAPPDGGAPLSIFETGAILEYLADRSGRFLPREWRPRFESLQWLYWQVGGLGPMAGQNHHFTQYAPEPIAYAIERYVGETARLYGVMDRRLADSAFIAGDYSIADMAIYPWIVPHERQRQDLDDFPNVKRWYEAIARRPAIVSAYAKGRSVNTAPVVTDEAKEVPVRPGRPHGPQKRIGVDVDFLPKPPEGFRLGAERGTPDNYCSGSETPVLGPPDRGPLTGS